MTAYSWDPVPDLCYSAALGWGGPFDGTTFVPWGSCSLHGAWDTSRFISCPACTSSVAVPFRIYPALPVESPPPVLEVVFDGPRPHRCPVCLGTGEVPNDFYVRMGFSEDAAPEPCRSCERGVVWR
jgi:hypothetical protein